MEHTTQIADASGTLHTYTITPHRGSEGMVLTQQLLALVIEPVAAGLGPMAVAAFTRGGVSAVLDSPDIMSALDFGALARGVRSALLGLPAPTVLALLRYTNRDGKPLVGDDGRATTAFDVAYARNYAELGKILWGVCAFNGFFPGLDTFASVAREAMGKLRAATPETPAKPG